MSNDQQAIAEVVQLYFMGTYHDNAEQLQQAFHPDARVTGIIKSQLFDWSLIDFIARVATRPTAAEQQEKYNKEILLIDVAGDAAMVKARVVVKNLIFTDYITLLKINGCWLIRNKSFTSD